MSQDQPTPADAESTSDPGRRSVLRGVLALGAVGLGGALGACGGSSKSASSDSVSSGSTPSGATAGSAAAGSSGSTPTPAGDSTAASGSGASLGPASGVPVGGGQVFAGPKVVVTQPSMGEYKAFTAVCTHEQCVVDNVSDGTINCACHGSKFNITDGSVVRGPADKPLAAKTVSVTGGNISVT